MSSSRPKDREQRGDTSVLRAAEAILTPQSQTGLRFISATATRWGQSVWLIEFRWTHKAMPCILYVCADPYSEGVLQIGLWNRNFKRHATQCSLHQALLRHEDGSPFGDKSRSTARQPKTSSCNGTGCCMCSLKYLPRLWWEYEPQELQSVQHWKEPLLSK